MNDVNYESFNALGSIQEPAYSEGWYRSFREWECRLELTPGEEPYEYTDAWLKLPLQRREVALERRRVILAYEKHSNPGDPEVQAAARELGITSGHFYNLLRRWRARRSIFVLTPYLDLDAPRRSRLEPGVAAAVTRIVSEAINHEGIRSPTAILRKIKDEWDLPQQIPSHMTLRKSVASALESFEGLTGKFVTVDSAMLPAAAIESAKDYGDVVVIDHTSPDIFVAGPGTAWAAYITLAIDLHTTSILGHCITLQKPGPTNVVRALRDAGRRSGEFFELGTEPVEPELVFSATTEPEWKKFIATIHRGGFGAHIRQTKTLHYGGLISRLIGRRLGELRLSQRKGHAPERVFDPKRDALVSLDQLDMMVERGIGELNRKRLPETITRKALRFPIPEFFGDD